MTTVASRVPTTSPSTQPLPYVSPANTASAPFPFGSSLRDAFQPLHRVQVQEDFSLRLPVDNLRDRAYHGRTQDDSLALDQPNPRRVVGYHRKLPFITKVSINHDENPLAHHPLKHVVNSGAYGGHCPGGFSL